MAIEWNKYKPKKEKVKYDLSELKCIVPDYGHFLSHAVRLSKDFKETIFVPIGWKESFSKPPKSMIGSGIPGLTVVRDFYDAKKMIDKEKDLIAFFDVGDGSLAADLREQGYKRVFSMGRAEIIEQNRYKAKELVESLGLSVIPYNGGDWKKGHIIGLTKLDERLKHLDAIGIEPKWIKLSTYRGLQETFKFESYVQVQSTLKKMFYEAGAAAENVEFLIEDDIPAVEGGSDHFFNGKKYFDRCIQGYEEKGDLYLAKAVNYSDLAKPLKKIVEAIIPFLQEHGAMGMISTEVRIDEKGNIYFTDPTMRSGNPPGDGQTYIWKNFSEMVYAAAGGEEVEPELIDEDEPYFCQLNVHSDWAEEEEMTIEYPKKYNDNVKLRNVMMNEGYIQYIPKTDMISIGSVIATAKDPLTSFERAKEIAAQIKCKSKEYAEYGWDAMQETLKNAEKAGLGKF